MQLSLPRLATLLALFAALSGCATVPAPAPPAGAQTLPTHGALGGRSWLARDPAALVAAIPPLPMALPDAPPAPLDPAVAAAWREPASRLVTAQLTAIAADAFDPVRAARAIMLLCVAMNDGLVAAAAARAAGVEVSDRAVVAEAALRVLAASHPRLEPLSPEEQAAAFWAGVWRGEESVAGVLNGRHLGAAAADAILAWAASDGAGAPRPAFAPPPPAPGVWAPTAPDYERPQEPFWGRVRTVAIDGPSVVRPPQPPQWGSPAMEAEIAAFSASQANLTAGQRDVARRWAGGPGTVTPPGMWVEVARELVARRRLALADAAGLYAALGVALHDSAVAAWEAKYRFMVARPAQVMPARDGLWAPLFNTPPHPSYPSGHAVFSGAASAVLAAAVPAEAAALDRLAQEVARSRVYAGIHWPMDGEAGLRQGRAVAAIVIAALGTP